MNTAPNGFVREDPWRIFRIMAEFVDSFETLSAAGTAVTIFGSARLPASDPYYKLGVQLGARLAKQNLAVITGGGPGIMEAANRGAAKAKGKSIGLNIELPHGGRRTAATTVCRTRHDGQARVFALTLCKTLAGEGWVDVVGVRRPWRNRGLGLALLRHAFTEYHRRGTHRVSLSVDAESITGAPRLYGRAGMRVREGYIIHLKELRPGVDLGMRLDEE